MITKFSSWLARKLAEESERDDIDLIRYGIEISISVLSKIIIFIVIAMTFHIYIEMFAIILSFVILRTISGGFHMSTYTLCLATSLFLFVAPVLLFKDIQIDSIISIGLFTYLFTTLIIFKYVPLSSDNRPIPKEKRHFFKWTSFGFVSIWFLVSIILQKIFPSYYYLFFFSSVGIILQAITLTPLGYKFLNTIDQFFQMKKERLEV